MFVFEKRFFLFFLIAQFYFLPIFTMRENPVVKNVSWLRLHIDYASFETITSVLNELGHVCIDSDSNTGLHYAVQGPIRANKLQLIRWFVENYNSDFLNHCNNNNETSLHSAVNYAIQGDNNKEAIVFLLENQELFDYTLNLNIQDVHGETPLFIAVKKNLHDIAKLLLSYGAEIDIENQEGSSPLSLAIFHEDYNMATVFDQYIAENKDQDYQDYVEKIRKKVARKKRKNNNYLRHKRHRKKSNLKKYHKIKRIIKQNQRKNQQILDLHGLKKRCGTMISGNILKKLPVCLKKIIDVNHKP